MKHHVIITALMALAVFSSATSQAATYKRYWVTPYGYGDDIPGLSGKSYTTQSTTTDAAGNPITTRTEVERSRDEYRRKTTVTGPDGLIGAKEVEIDYGRDKVKRKIITTNPDGSIDIETQRYRLDN